MPNKNPIILINPNLVLQKNDIFTTGIVYLTIGLAYLAAALREQGYHAKVIDAFGENPNHIRLDGKFLFRGLTENDIIQSIPSDAFAIFIYANHVTHHISVIRITQEIKQRYPEIPVIILENSQAVTSYYLPAIQNELLCTRIDFFITGEAEIQGPKLIDDLMNGGNGSGIDGVGWRFKDRFECPVSETFIHDLDGLAFPAWDLFPLQNYWNLKYAHGPFETKRYLSILTSRGCPYNCNFCVIPKTNNQRWRARSAKNVVDEMEEHLIKFGVNEFHIEDVDPTVQDKRTREICTEILRRKLNVIWKISSGTKVETILDESTLELMAKSGCRYISISPETGSPEMLKRMNKPFNLDHAVQMITKMNQVGICSQACFVVGYPDETDDDRGMTRDLVHELTKAGVDEIALFIITPVPGSAIHDRFSGYSDYSELNFSPTWRRDYNELNQFRLDLYRNFLLWKFRYYPGKIVKQSVNFLKRNFETKMEMTAYRALHTTLCKLRH